MKLLLIRHGDPDYANDTLTPKGINQAQLLSQNLKHTQIDEIFISPMGRAKLTAEFTVRKKSNVKTEELLWLHELNGNYKDDLWAWNQHGCDLLWNVEEFTACNWNDHVEFGQHMKSVSDGLFCEFDKFMASQGFLKERNFYRIEEANDKTIVFFCHAGVILTLLSYLLHIPLPVVYSQFMIDPSSVTSLISEEKDGYCVFRLLNLNDTSHAQDQVASVRQTGHFID